MLRHFGRNSYTCPQLKPPESLPNRASLISSFAFLCSSPPNRIGITRGLNAETCWFLQVYSVWAQHKMKRNLLVESLSAYGRELQRDFRQILAGGFSRTLVWEICASKLEWRRFLSRWKHQFRVMRRRDWYNARFEWPNTS